MHFALPAAPVASGAHSGHSVGMERPRLRLLAILVTIHSLATLGRVATMWSDDPSFLRRSGPWFDSIVVRVEPVIGLLGLVAAAGIWSRRRWGAVAFAAWLLLLTARLGSVIAYAAAMTGLGWPAVVVAALLFGGIVAVLHWMLRWIWRSTA